MFSIDKKYLPSKKFISSLYISIGIILFVIILSYWEPSTTNYKNNILGTNISTSTIAAINLDTDNDGLVDWKESLYGTDPKKTDTDSDGTNDNEEVSKNRDPLKTNTSPKGEEPNDKINPEIIEKNKKDLEEYNKLTSTEKMARNLMSNILASIPASGQDISSEQTNYIIQKSIEDFPKKEYLGITKVTDLNLIDITKTKISADNLMGYAKGYADATESFRDIIGLDLIIINDYLSSGKDPKKDMSKITSKYQQVIDALIKTPLPAVPDSTGAIVHLTLINDLEKLIMINNDIINTNIKNTADIYSGIIAYNEVFQEIISILKNQDAIFKIIRY